MSFVDGERGDDGGDGSRVEPYRTLGQALAQAAGGDVYVRSVGTYDESGATLAIDSTTSVYGGFDDNWTREPADRAEVLGRADRASDHRGRAWGVVLARGARPVRRQCGRGGCGRRGRAGDVRDRRQPDRRRRCRGGHGCLERRRARRERGRARSCAVRRSTPGAEAGGAVRQNPIRGSAAPCREAARRTTHAAGAGASVPSTVAGRWRRRRARRPLERRGERRGRSDGRHRRPAGRRAGGGRRGWRRWRWAETAGRDTSRGRRSGSPVSPARRRRRGPGVVAAVVAAATVRFWSPAAAVAVAAGRVTAASAVSVAAAGAHRSRCSSTASDTPPGRVDDLGRRSGRRVATARPGWLRSRAALAAVPAMSAPATSSL